MQIVLYVVSQSLVLPALSTSPICSLPVSSLLPMSVAKKGFAAVKVDLFYEHEHICKIHLSHDGLHNRTNCL